MLFVVGAIVVLIALVLVPRLQAGNDTSAHTLGRMSEQWLNECRASDRG